MSNTTFSGPVRSENGFQSVTKNATTGAVTVTATFGAATSVTTISATGTTNVIVIPTVDPAVAGAIWNNAGTLAISAG
jgi:hypothetical protein